MRRGQTYKAAVLAGALLVLAVVLADVGMPEVARFIDPPPVDSTPTPELQPLVVPRPRAVTQIAGLPPTLVAAAQLRAAVLSTQLPTPVPTEREATLEPKPAPQVVASGPAAAVVVPVAQPPTTPTPRPMVEPAVAAVEPAAPTTTPLPTSPAPPIVRPAPSSPEPAQGLAPGTSAVRLPITLVPARSLAVARPEQPEVAKPEVPKVIRPERPKPAKVDPPKPAHKRDR